MSEWQSSIFLKPSFQVFLNFTVLDLVEEFKIIAV